MNPTLLAGLISLVVVLFLTPWVRVFAKRFGIVAHPGGRRVHARATPMLGGVAMFIGFMVAVIAVILLNPGLLSNPMIRRQTIGILIGGTFVAIMGVIDDKYELPGWVQALTIVMGGVILVLADVRVHHVTNPFKGGYMLPLPGYVSIFITITWVLMVTKAVDCMDGLDGLAAGISAIAAATLMLMALSGGKKFGMSAIMAAALLGTTIGFLRLNYPPAKIFMGTVGAQFLGFMLAGISIAGAFKLATLFAMAAPVLVLGVPLLDTSFVVIRRIFAGRKIHEADTSHLHHRLVDKGLSHRQVIWAIYALTLASCTLAYVLFRFAKGDTTTTFVASLAAFYNKIPFGHVEAGLRTNNKYDPFPEEINRRLTGVICDLHFAPTEFSRQNLLREGIDEANVFVTGNTVIDALLSIAAGDYVFEDDRVRAAADSGKMILMTAHRRENWGEPMKHICAAVKEILRRNPDYTLVFPVHKNPIVRDVVFPELEGVDGVVLTEPPDYVPFVYMMKAAHIILTDSGGVQEEAPSFGKPVLVLRKTTERPEGVDAGSAKLVGTDIDVVVGEAEKLLKDESAYNAMAHVRNPYGDGRAAERIWEIIRSRFIV
ncbi:MAG: UDP-N-acetylglucosamine 2-epimerase (non-hydrolyzing) [Armatimonadetes bacterium]|nr:UDP-N-acetylglucosamine 2-epimerase (non-hydrolyzing) [Armatimonadota bacterium]